jgi:hypothetical protein
MPITLILQFQVYLDTLTSIMAPTALIFIGFLLAHLKTHQIMFFLRICRILKLKA